MKLIRVLVSLFFLQTACTKKMEITQFDKDPVLTYTHAERGIEDPAIYISTSFEVRNALRHVWKRFDPAVGALSNDVIVNHSSIFIRTLFLQSSSVEHFKELGFDDRNSKRLRAVAEKTFAVRKDSHEDDVLNFMRIEFDELSSCSSESKIHKIASVMKSEKLVKLCFSVPELRKFKKEFLFTKILAQFAHSLVHLNDFSEDDAIAIQKAVELDLRVSSKDISFETFYLKNLRESFSKTYYLFDKLVFSLLDKQGDLKIIDEYLESYSELDHLVQGSVSDAATMVSYGYFHIYYLEQLVSAGEFIKSEVDKIRKLPASERYKPSYRTLILDLLDPFDELQRGAELLLYAVDNPTEKRIEAWDYPHKLYLRSHFNSKDWDAQFDRKTSGESNESPEEAAAEL